MFHPRTEAPEFIDLNTLLNEAQRAVLETTRRFAESEVLPRAKTIDADDEFPRDIFRKMAAAGMFGINLPEAHGGSGFDTVCFSLAMEELAAASGAVGNILAIPVEMVRLLAEKGDAYHRSLIPEILAGDLIPATAVTEPEGGSDVAAMRGTAMRDGDEYRITATKAWLSLGLVADFVVVFARTSADKGHRGISAFIVERGSRGITFGRKEKLLGMRGLATCAMMLDDVRVPARNLLGEEGGAFKMAMANFDYGRIAMASMALGMARAAMEDSLAYARQRIQFGKPIFEHQAVQFMLADMAKDVAASRLLIHHAAQKMDLGLPIAQDAAIAKLFTTDMAMLHATNAIQIHGANGYSADYRVERIFRDVKLAQIYEGTNQIQRMIIARGMLRDSGR
jgi:alkylation response protein AidB-like acyl-CoA dehydrogenase